MLLAALSCVSLHTFTEALILDSEHLHFGTAHASSHVMPVSTGSNTSAQMSPVDAGNHRNRKISGFTEMNRINTRKTFNVSLPLFFSMQAPSLYIFGLICVRMYGFKNCCQWAAELSQQIKVLPAKPDNRSSIPRNQGVKGRKTNS